MRKDGKSMKKRIICFGMAIMLFVVTACGTGAEKTDTKEELKSAEEKETDNNAAGEKEDSANQQLAEEASDAGNKNSGVTEDNDAESTESEEEQSEPSSEQATEEDTEVSDEPTKDGNTPIADEDIAELKSYIKEAVISEYLEPNGMTAAQLEWTEDNWFEFSELQNSAGILLSTLGKSNELTVDSPTDAAIKGIEKWFLEHGSFDHSYFKNVMDKLQPFYEVIPAIL